METLQTPYGKFTAYINLLNASRHITYHISFVDNENKLRTVLMTYDKEEWSIEAADDQPDWILALKPTLQNLIMKNIAQERAN